MLRMGFDESNEGALRLLAVFCGIAGPIALTVYFAAPAFSSWPYAGASAAQITSYAIGHASLFYAGAWFQVTGTLLCVVFFLAILQIAGTPMRLPGLLVIVASTTLLGVVLVEAALLVAVPTAAAAGDTATAVTTFDLSNGAFVRVFPLAPASVTYIALGAVLLGSRLLQRWLALVAVGLGIAFELAGIIAVFSSAGLIVTIVLSAAQEVWIVTAAIALWRSGRCVSFPDFRRKALCQDRERSARPAGACQLDRNSLHCRRYRFKDASVQAHEIPSRSDGKPVEIDPDLIVRGTHQGPLIRSALTLIPLSIRLAIGGSPNSMKRVQKRFAG